MNILTVSPSMKRMNRFGLLKRSFSPRRKSLEKDNSLTRVKAHPNILKLNKPKTTLKHRVITVYKKVVGYIVSYYNRK